MVQLNGQLTHRLKLLPATACTHTACGHYHTRTYRQAAPTTHRHTTRHTTCTQPRTCARTCARWSAHGRAHHTLCTRYTHTHTDSASDAFPCPMPLPHQAASPGTPDKPTKVPTLYLTPTFSSAGLCRSAPRSLPRPG